MTSRELLPILIAEDDADDRMLIKQALQKGRLANDVITVEDGEELLAYLHRQEPYDDPRQSPTPGLILLDLNMPRMDGREALRAIKSDRRLRRIPVIVLTTSGHEEDVLQSYDLGANAYITKPVSFDGLVRVVSSIDAFWFQIVQRPPVV